MTTSKVTPIDSHPRFKSKAPICIMPRQKAREPDETDTIHADMTLGMFDQNFAKDRDDLIQYAQRQDLVADLPRFLQRRGWLDDDWTSWHLADFSYPLYPLIGNNMPRSPRPYGRRLHRYHYSIDYYRDILPYG